jgi:hypothetical protein
MKTILVAAVMVSGFSQPVQATTNTEKLAKHCAFMAGLVAANQVERQSHGSLEQARARIIADVEIPVGWKSAFLSSIRITERFPLAKNHLEIEVEFYDSCIRSM